MKKDDHFKEDSQENKQRRSSNISKPQNSISKFIKLIVYYIISGGRKSYIE